MLNKRSKWIKGIAITCVCTMALPVAAFAAVPQDAQGHWAEKAITQWVEKGLLNGYQDGTVRPNNQVTRAEFMTMVNNAKGYTTLGTVNFSDVPANAWYYNQLAIAMGQGYITGLGDGTFSAEGVVTRAQAAVMIAKMQGLADNGAYADSFADAVAIPSWAKSAIGAVAEAGFMVGTNNQFNAGLAITRAEAVSALERVLNPVEQVAQAEDVVITKAGTVLKDQTIAGNLVIDKAVGNSDVTLDNVIVNGKVVVEGGGKNSIYLINTTVKNAVVANKADGNLRIVFQGNTTAASVVAQSGVELAAKDFKGTVPTVTVAPSVKSTQTVTIGVPATTVNVQTAAKIEAKADVKNLIVTKDAANASINIAKDVKVGTVEANAKIAITGNGSVGTLQANASGITTSGSVTTGNTTTAPGVNNPTTSTPSGGGGGGGGGGSTTPTTYTATMSSADQENGTVTTIATFNTNVNKVTITIPKDAKITVGPYEAKATQAISFTVNKTNGVWTPVSNTQVTFENVTSSTLSDAYRATSPYLQITADTGAVTGGEAAANAVVFNYSVSTDDQTFTVNWDVPNLTASLLNGLGITITGQK